MRRGLAGLVFWLVVLGPMWALEWTALEVNSPGLASVEALLLRQNIPSISPTSASVEISDYGGVVTEKVNRLTHRLTTEDPRWDPWLQFWVDRFASTEKVVLWVPQAQASAVVRELPDVVRPLGGGNSQSPIRLLAWTVLVAGLLGVVFWGISMVGERLRRWRGLALFGLLTALGIGLLQVPTGVALSPKLAELYRHHLWYQWALPYGSRWDDYAAGGDVLLETFVRQEGRLVSSPSLILRPDRAWFTERADELDVTNVAHLVGDIFP